MKKFLPKFMTVALIVAMTMCFAACGSKDGDKAEGASVDMSAFPKDINEWTTEDFNKYYTDAGVYTDESLVYVQDHATYFAGMEINEGCGYMDDDANYYVAIFTFDPENGEGDVKGFLDKTRENKALMFDDGEPFPVDHMAGNVTFSYGLSLDQDFSDDMEKATQDLFKALDITPDF